MLRGSKYILIILTITICWSCSITRHIPEEKDLLSKVHVEQSLSTPKDELISTSTLSRYIRQSPNKRLFGMNFYLWVYYQANPEKSNWWNDFKRKVGQEPVYYDQNQTLKSQENLNVYMDSQGFYASEASFSVDTMSRDKRAIVTYYTHQGRPYIINKLSYRFDDKELQPIVAPDTTNTLIHKGDIFSVTLLDKERERITSSLRSQGYFDFTVRNIEYQADTLAGNYTVDLEMIIKKEVAGYDQRGDALYKNNTRYNIGKVNIFPNFDPTVIISDTTLIHQLDTMEYRGLNIVHKAGEHPNVRPKVLRQAIPINEGTLYSSKSVEQAYQNLIALGYFKSARINFKADETPVDSLTTNNLSTLTSNILCTPALKQSYDIELEGSTTSSFYGLYGTIGYQNRNIFRGAEAWDVDFTVGYEHMKAPDAVKTRATELGISTGLTFPRFLLPGLESRITGIVQPKTSFEISTNFQDRPYYNRTLSSASINYSWRNKRYSTFTVKPIDINIIDMKYIDDKFYSELENDYLRNSYETQLIAGLSVGYYYNNQRKNLNGNYTMVRINAESSGNLLNLFEQVFNSSRVDGYYEILGIRYAQYLRSDINISRRIIIGERSAIAGRIFAGAGWAYGNSTAIPFDRLFYSGGSNSMRGWTPRTLGPGSVAEEKDVVYPSQLGDMKLEANLEFRFPLWNNLHGATFLDLGNIWYIRDSEGVYNSAALFSRDFYKQLGFNTGLGLRLDIKFAVLRLDWGVQIHNPNKAAGDRWVIRDLSFSNTALNFGVGYPF